MIRLAESDGIAASSVPIPVPSQKTALVPILLVLQKHAHPEGAPVTPEAAASIQPPPNVSKQLIPITQPPSNAAPSSATDGAAAAPNLQSQDRTGSPSAMPAATASADRFKAVLPIQGRFWCPVPDCSRSYASDSAFPGYLPWSSLHAHVSRIHGRKVTRGCHEDCVTAAEAAANKALTHHSKATSAWHAAITQNRQQSMPKAAQADAADAAACSTTLLHEDHLWCPHSSCSDAHGLGNGFPDAEALQTHLRQTHYRKLTDEILQKTHSMQTLPVAAVSVQTSVRVAKQPVSHTIGANSADADDDAPLQNLDQLCSTQASGSDSHRTGTRFSRLTGSAMRTYSGSPRSSKLPEHGADAATAATTITSSNASELGPLPPEDGRLYSPSATCATHAQKAILSSVQMHQYCRGLSQTSTVKIPRCCAQ